MAERNQMKAGHKMSEAALEKARTGWSMTSLPEYKDYSAFWEEDTLKISHK